MNNKKIFISILWIVLGITLFVLASMEILDSEYFSGMGGGLIAVGAMQIFSFIRCKKDENYRRRVSIKQNDERFKYLQMKSWVITGKITILGLAIMSIIFFTLHQPLLQEFTMYLMCGVAIVYTIVFYILSKKN